MRYVGHDKKSVVMQTLTMTSLVPVTWLSTFSTYRDLIEMSSYSSTPEVFLYSSLHECECMHSVHTHGAHTAQHNYVDNGHTHIYMYVQAHDRYTHAHTMSCWRLHASDPWPDFLPLHQGIKRACWLHSRPAHLLPSAQNGCQG